MIPANTSMVAALLLLFSHLLTPIRGEKDFLFRIDVMNAIAAATPDPIEQQTLVRIAAYESNYSRAFARCDYEQDKTLADHGRSKGVFQVQPQTPEDAKAACGSLEGQARLALAYAKHGAAACGRDLRDSAKSLYVYVSGLCHIDGRAAKMAERRWGGTPVQVLEEAK